MHFQLVDDVLMEILDYSYRSNQRLPDYQPLCSFSLVSKAWSYEAQKRLFSEGLSAAHRIDPIIETLQSIYQAANILVYSPAV